MAAIAIIIRIIYQVYCHRHFAEARYHFSIDRAKMGEISRFAGISTLGGILYTISGEGIMLVINWTFGVAINAVYTIALQLKNMILSFALNLFKAIQPQITKTYAEGALDVHRRLVYSGSKLEVYLIYFLMLPFLCRTEQIMVLWLGDVPAYAVSYAQGIVFISLTYAAFEPIRTAVLATGRIVKFMLIPDSLTLLVLPISYLVARMTGSPTWMLVSIVGMEMFACALRVWLGAQVSALRVSEILSRIVLPAAVVALVDAVLCYFLSRLLPDDLWGLILLVLLNSLLLLGIIYAIGLSAEERRSILSLRKKSVREQT
jgi:O-antigen/teichoic acid export membrane protein